MPITISGSGPITGVSSITAASTSLGLYGSGGASSIITGISTVAGGVISQRTSVASTSGTSIDFTGIPSWVKRITVMFQGVSTSGGSDYLVRIGSGSVAATGYTGASSRIVAAVVSANYTTGFGVNNGTQAGTYVSNGVMTITLLDASSNIWTEFAVFGGSDSATTTVSGGSKTLSGSLDRVRITTVNGTDTFDAGTINIMYEG